VDSSSFSNALDTLLGRCRHAAHAPSKSDQPQHAQESPGLLQRSREAAQIHRQDDKQPSQEQGKAQEQGQKQGQQEAQTANDKEHETQIWRERITRERQQRHSSGDNQDNSGNGGNQDGYQRAQGRSLPEEQQQKGRDHSRGR
jgi:hypothetical protein